jgi:hypothetical protein
VKKILALIFMMTIASAAFAQSSAHPKITRMNPPNGQVDDVMNASSVPNGALQKAGNASIGAAQQGNATTSQQAGKSTGANNGGGRKVCRTIKSIDYYCL